MTDFAALRDDASDMRTTTPVSHVASEPSGDPAVLKTACCRVLNYSVGTRRFSSPCQLGTS